MKLHRLELEGFGPFLTRQVVDFDAFADDGIFLIAGRTGAGKSSVLDGVCYALFGGIPRYDTGDKRLRSDHCAPDDPTEVVLEFTAAGRRWRVSRSPEYDRPKRHGEGLTKESPQALLEVYDDGEWTGVAARPRDVAAELDVIVGLSQQQFLQVILLAQNRFARFLLARNDERQAVLRTLFGTRTYGDYERLLEERRKEAERSLDTSGETARMLLAEAEATALETGVGDPGDTIDQADLPARLGALVRAVDRAAYRVEASAQHMSAAEAEADAVLERHRAATALHDKQVRRVEARRALELLDAAVPVIDRDRERLALAAAAEALRPVLDAADRAATAARSAAEASGSAGAAWLAAGESAITADDLRARDDALAAAAAHATEALAADDELAAAHAESTAAKAGAEEADRSIAELDDRRAAVPSLRASLDERLAVLASAPAARDAAKTRLGEASLRRDAAREAEKLSGPLEAAERAVIAAATRLVDAAANHTALLQRRLDSAAGDLARELVDGTECPVCGATQHPRPAHPSGAPVSDTDIDEAAREKDAALAADRDATAAATAAREEYAAVAARAAGLDLASLDTEVAEVTAALVAAEADVVEAERLTRERTELVALDAEAAAARESLVAEAAVLRQTAALADQRAQTLARRVAARGSFSTVAERLSDAKRRREMLRAVIEATADASLRSQVLADTTADLAARLEASRFADADAALAALLDAPERRALDERIGEHDASRRARKQSLLELELDLADAPDEPIDLVPIAADAAAARARLTDAAAAHATATAAATRLRDLAERADAAHRGIAEQAERHAVIARLANTVAGRAPNTHRMTLETFVLAAELEEIVQAANLRLDEMSAGRYRLQHTDALAARGAASGLGLAVLDAFTGQARPPQSLSGGETFLASLALALGLAEVVTARAGGMRLDTLFIDEGFGSLDDDTLDLAMRALDELRQGGRTVGVISHVALMKEQIPAQLAVRITPQGPSVIRQDANVPA